MKLRCIIFCWMAIGALAVQGCAASGAGGAPVLAAPTRIAQPANAKAPSDGATPAPLEGGLDKTVPESDREDVAARVPAAKPAPPALHPGPTIIGEDGTGGNLSPRAAAALKGRIKPPAFIDIDGDGAPDISVLRQGEGKGYVVSFREAGRNADSMEWTYGDDGRLVHFVRDIDADGLADEILDLRDEAVRVYRGKAGDVFVFRYSRGLSSLWVWNSAPGRPLASEIMFRLDQDAPENILKQPADIEVHWRRFGGEWEGPEYLLTRKDGTIVESIVRIDGCLDNPPPPVPANTKTGKARPVTCVLPGHSPTDTYAQVNELPAKSPGLQNLKPSLVHLYPGVICGEGKPLRYALNRLVKSEMGSIFGPPEEAIGAWRRSIAEVFRLDLVPSDLWKSRLMAFKDGRVIWERRDRDGDGIYETKVISQTAIETITERIDGTKSVREVYLKGELVQMSEDDDADGNPEKITYFENAKPARVEIDTDRDGRVNRWEYLTEGKVVLDTNSDGLPDKWESRTVNSEK